MTKQILSGLSPPVIIKEECYTTNIGDDISTVYTFVVLRLLLLIIKMCIKYLKIISIPFYIHNTTIPKSTSMFTYVSTRNILYLELSTEQVIPMNKLDALWASTSMLLSLPCTWNGK